MISGRFVAVAAALAAASGIGWASPASTSGGPPTTQSAASTSEKPPAPLSKDHRPVDIHSSAGSGHFGKWIVDSRGLPAYAYRINELTAPQAVQPELDGSRDGWSQIGNNRLTADTFNHGYTELWSTDHLIQRDNAYDAASDHFAGGFGYLHTNKRTVSSLYDDRPKHARTTRIMGVDYYRKTVAVRGEKVAETDYAPWGNAPVLLDDVKVTNTSRHALQGSWFEYWDVDPETQALESLPRGIGATRYSSATKTLSVTQEPDEADSTIGTAVLTSRDQQPESIFASALNTPVRAVDGDAQAFFGSGSRKRPAAVAAGHVTGALAGPSPDGTTGRSAFVFQTPVHLAPGRSITLHYAYGNSEPANVAPLVHRLRRDRHPLRHSERHWGSYLPQFSVGHRPWLSRELEWDAYELKSGESYDGGCGHHTITQGGYYTYGFGVNIAYRDPLQYAAAIVNTDPNIAAQIIDYSAREQPQATGELPYGVAPECVRFDLGTSDDLNLWLLWATTRYVESTRDFSFLNSAVPYYLQKKADSGGTIWDHLKLAFQNQESLIGRGPHGEYLVGATGDWSDLSTEELQMTESDLVTAQAPYIYDQLAAVAAAHGHRSFARQLRAAAARDLKLLRGQWISDGKWGWYARGYSGVRQIGKGAIFEEPQPWALLDHAGNAAKDRKIVRAYRRFLVGVHAPKVIRGPAKTGAALTPAADDPDVTERSTPAPSGNASNFVSGSWFSPNGWMVWALGQVAHVVPGAGQDAWSELTRNTLRAHAHVYPNAWDGVLSVDDVCNSFYSKTPAVCGIGLVSSYDTEIYHSDAWTLFDLTQLDGLTPTAQGFDIDPVLPSKRFSMRQRTVGLAGRPGMLRGYLRPVRGGPVVLRVTVPSTRGLAAYIGRHRVPVHRTGHVVRLMVRTTTTHAADWAVTWHTG